MIKFFQKKVLFSYIVRCIYVSHRLSSVVVVNKCGNMLTGLSKMIISYLAPTYVLMYQFLKEMGKGCRAKGTYTLLFVLAVSIAIYGLLRCFRQTARVMMWSF